MNIEKRCILGYLTEDNTQRAFFSIRPLVTDDGQIFTDAQRQEAWPDCGTLRIVPDKREQYYFKERLRNLGHWGVIDLTRFTAEFSKIRTNKNYRPENGELNRFILYSDAVKAVGVNCFFEVLMGSVEGLMEFARVAATPLFYIRDGGVIYGPIRREKPVAEPAKEIPGQLCTLPCPDGKIRTIAVVKAVPVERPAPRAPKAEQRAEAAETPAQPAPAAAPVSQEKPVEAPAAEPQPAEPQPAEAPPTEKKAEEAQPEAVPEAAGEPVREAAAPAAEPEPAPAPRQPMRPEPWRAPERSLPLSPAARRNRTTMAVNARNEGRQNNRTIPPAEDLPRDAVFEDAENPVAAAMSALQRVWGNPDARLRLIGEIGSLPGFWATVSRFRRTDEEKAKARALEEGIAQLEEERIRHEVALRRAKENVEAYQNEVLAAMSQRKKAVLQSLDQEIARARKELASAVAEKPEESQGEPLEE